MKIVINGFSARLGGGKTYLINLLRNLPADESITIDLFGPEDLQIAPDPRIRRVQTAWPTSNPLLRALWERLSLPRYLKAVDADILFCPGGVVATRTPAGCRVVTMFRNMLPFDLDARRRMPWGLQRMRNWLLQRVLLKSMAGADLTIFISDHARRLIESMVRIPNAVTIPHGIAPAFRTFGQALPRPEQAGHGEYLLYVSRFDVYKHHFEVVQAYARLGLAARASTRLLLIGETGSEEAARVRTLVNSLGLQEQVLFLGPMPYAELPAFYHHARAIIFASTCENCPNILLEALGAGRPLLSSNVMPMPEFGGPDIAYFTPTDPSTLSAELQRVLDDPAHAAKLSAASAERSNRYDWARTAQSTWAEILHLARSSETSEMAAPRAGI